MSGGDTGGIRTEPIGKWVRGRLAGALVAETREPVLVWQGPFPPVYGLPREAITAGVLQPAEGASYPGSWFHGPHHPVAQWYDVVVGETRLPCAAWSLDAPEIAHLVTFTWEPGLLEWTEESEQVTAHPRDPHKRVEALHSSRHVQALVGEVVLADSHETVMLFETDLPTRFYFPQAHVRMDLLTLTSNTSVCPYKGFAERYWTYAGPPQLRNVAWSYAQPFSAVDKIAGRVSFYNELVDFRVDGELLERPRSPFSEAGQRPGAG